MRPASRVDDRPAAWAIGLVVLSVLAMLGALGLLGADFLFGW